MMLNPFWYEAGPAPPPPANLWEWETGIVLQWETDINIELD